MRVNSLFKHLTYRVFAPGTVLRKTYVSFKNLLSHDSRCHELMAELESYYYQGIKVDFCKISQTYHSFAKNVEAMVICLEEMAPAAYHDVHAYFRKCNFYAGFFLEPPVVNISPPYVLEFNDSIITSELAGTKTSKLIELGSSLGLTIPDGFIISTNCFSYLLEYNDLQSKINKLLARISLIELTQLEELSKELQCLVGQMEIPADITAAIEKAGSDLQKKSKKENFAVRSSAIAEDGECSFAGQYISCLDVSIDSLLASYKKVLASKYSTEALVYRISRGLFDTEAAMAVMVLPMLDVSSAGVMYTTDFSGVNTDKLFIHAAEGTGEKVVSGIGIPDIYTMEKKSTAVTRFTKGNSQRKEQRISDAHLAELAKAGLQIEKHFKGPQDIEWAVEKNGSLVFLQCRPLAIPQKYDEDSCCFTPDKKRELFSAGECASFGIASGIAAGPEAISKLPKEHQKQILLLQATRPSYVKLLPQVGGVIAAFGSGAGHFSTVCREFGIPLLLGTGEEIKKIKEGSMITLHADHMKVYSGELSSAKQRKAVYQCEKDLPFFRKLLSMLEFITPLKLVDPAVDNFTPQACRSLHDIIRFCHEKAVHTMFSIGDQAGRAQGVKKCLETDLPFDVFLVDIDHGIKEISGKQSSVAIDNICCTPFIPFWNGLSNPSIAWENKNYYDWKSYDKMAVSDAFAFQSPKDSASYAVLGEHYLNINIRFGYHFTVLDALCEPDSNNNYCSIRFAGGGGNFEGRNLRIRFLSTVLERLDFDVHIRGDLLDASLSHVSCKLLKKHLESLGLLFAVTKQMDIHLHTMADVNNEIEKYFTL